MDAIEFEIVRIAPAQMTVPRWQISGKLVESDDHGVVYRDFTGANVQFFPNVLGSLAPAEQDRWVNSVVMDLLYAKFAGEA